MTLNSKVFVLSSKSIEILDKVLTAKCSEEPAYDTFDKDRRRALKEIDGMLNLFSNP